MSVRILSYTLSRHLVDGMTVARLMHADAESH